VPRTRAGGGSMDLAGFRPGAARLQPRGQPVRGRSASRHRRRRRRRRAGLGAEGGNRLVRRLGADERSHAHDQDRRRLLRHARPPRLDRDQARRSNRGRLAARDAGFVRRVGVAGCLRPPRRSRHRRPERLRRPALLPASSHRAAASSAACPRPGAGRSAARSRAGAPGDPGASGCAGCSRAGAVQARRTAGDGGELGAACGSGNADPDAGRLGSRTRGRADRAPQADPVARGEAAGTAGSAESSRSGPDGGHRRVRASWRSGASFRSGVAPSSAFAGPAFGPGSPADGTAHHLSHTVAPGCDRPRPDCQRSVRFQPSRVTGASHTEQPPAPAPPSAPGRRLRCARRAGALAAPSPGRAGRGGRPQARTYHLWRWPST
jgi:hypothetical protein